MIPDIESPAFPADIVFTFSQSSLQDYLDCPRRFQLRYVLDALVARSRGRTSLGD